jgi:hypothetical protein
MTATLEIMQCVRREAVRATCATPFAQPSRPLPHAQHPPLAARRAPDATPRRAPNPTPTARSTRRQAGRAYDYNAAVATMTSAPPVPPPPVPQVRPPPTPPTPPPPAPVPPTPPQVPVPPTAATDANAATVRRASHAPPRRRGAAGTNRDTFNTNYNAATRPLPQ